MIDTDFQSMDLTGKEIEVKLGREVHVYSCIRRAGAGKTAVTWEIKDQFGVIHALKLVPKERYVSHNIPAEMGRVKRLPKRFAQMLAFGDPYCDDIAIQCIFNSLSAIVVEWVNGKTLREFCDACTDGFDAEQFLRVAHDLCETLALLQREGLVHRDLHADNIMIREQQSGPLLTNELEIKIIDTGSMMTAHGHRDLLDQWRNAIVELEKVHPDPGSAGAIRIETLRRWINWFSRTDQEWIVSHFCTFINAMNRHENRLPSIQRRFLRELPVVLSRMVDPDPSQRIDQAADMYQQLEALWKKSVTPTATQLQTPFDFISAELIRTDGQLNDLFSEKCPWFERCGTTDPVYIYGPRGCGKSTILRKLSLSAVLGTEQGTKEFDGIPFVGVYISCSSELRSRFWLFPEEQYPIVQGSLVLFFTLLLAEALLDTLELLRDENIQTVLGRSVGLTNDTAHEIFRVAARVFRIPATEQKLQGVSWLTHARRKLAIRRSEVWHDILLGVEKKTPEPSLIFDFCKAVEVVFPLLATKHVAFLIDDYSNQRIPAGLQRMLNQTISFAKQGNPIFKVTSEYHGVDLEGIQEGREVIEVNLGKEYVDLVDRERSVFLEDVLDIRFRQTGVKTTAQALLGRSGLSPGVQMARAIRDAELPDGKKFYYYGVDTIADICSGDLAMALDLVRHIYVEVKDKLPLSSPVSDRDQHEVIHRYSDREHFYLRYIASHGKQIAAIAGALCRLAHRSAVALTSSKDKRDEPMIKTHLDISNDAVQRLPNELKELLLEMERKGVIFSLDTSRSRIDRKGTERYQVRRILLVQKGAPLGRRDPIKLDNDQRLRYLLQNPDEFVEEELTGQKRLRLWNA